MNPKDSEVGDDKSPSSPPSTEVSICPDYISSYTQISQYNEETSEQTEVASSDDEADLSDDLQPDPTKNDSALPELSSQIVEWTKEKTSQCYEEEKLPVPGTSDKSGDDSNCTQEESTATEEETDLTDPDRLKFFSIKLVNDLEKQAMSISQNLNEMMKYISEFCSKATSSTVGMMQLYHDNVFEICDSIDLNIKLMYRIMSKCEELNKSLSFLDDLKNQIKHIKQTLDTFERIIV